MRSQKSVFCPTHEWVEIHHYSDRQKNYETIHDNFVVPVDVCINNGAKNEEILGIKYNILPESKILKRDVEMMEFSFFIYKKFFRKLRQQNIHKITNEILIPCDTISLQECKDLLEDADKRGKYIKDGRQAVRLFLSYRER